MSTLFDLRPGLFKEKPVSVHPWEKTIKAIYAQRVKHAHNSIKNPCYPKIGEKDATKDRVKFSVIGDRVTKEFIYCSTLVKGLHKYRPKYFHAPTIRGVNSVEWPDMWRCLKIQYGGLAHCLLSKVAVLKNDEIIGGETELRELIESKYIYHLTLDYYNEAISNFAVYIRSSGRPCAFMQISINDEPVGTLIFMLYSDILPYTCDNFLRLCTLTKGGYSGTPIHRIVKDGWIQGGGYGLKKTDLDCENFIVPHDKRGVLCMANDDRHVDCSTQFFVLLQPTPWMAHKYVAFGQLIEGATTLEKIENVPTWYESPTSDIKIFKAGIFNMECHNITINKGTNEYIQGHIEDLVALGDKLIENLLKRVFLEIELKYVQLLEKELLGEGEEEETTNTLGGIHPTKRFIRNKEEMAKSQVQTAQAIKSQVTASSPAKSQLKPAQLGQNQTNPTQPAKSDIIRKRDEVDENNDFDVEEYELEESSYQHVSIKSSSIVVKAEKPYYIPLTDVQYPGEVDSTYDIKKFLRGDYCLESDLDLKITREDRVGFSAMDKMFIPPIVQDSSSGSESESYQSLDSDQEREIRHYIRVNVDQVSFAGGIVKNIAMGTSKYPYSDDIKNSRFFRPEYINDEDLRRIRLRSLGERFTVEHNKKVSISVPGTYTGEHSKIKRRQTGFVRQKDIEKLQSLSNLDTTAHHKKVSISVADSEKTEKSKIKRRQTGYVRPKDLQKLSLLNHYDEEQKKVRIVPSDSDVGAPFCRLSQRYTDFCRLHDTLDSDHEINTLRPSVLHRLYNDVAYMDDYESTLKEFKPHSEVTPKNVMLTYSPFTDPRERQEDYHDKSHRRTISKDAESIENILSIQHGKKFARKISSDYVKTIDQIEHKFENSIRSIEYAKTRPSMSVTAYQTKNRQIQKELKFKNAKENGSLVSVSKGIRLPGDTPLYSMSEPCEK